MRARVAEGAAAFAAKYGRQPGLVGIQVGDDPASEIYQASKAKAAEEAGMSSRRIKLPAETTQAELDALIDELNADDAVDGMLVQLPVPDHLSEPAIAARIHPDKDVDGFGAVSLGRLMRGEPGLVACTPSGVMHLLHEAGVADRGRPRRGRRAQPDRRQAHERCCSLAEHATVTIAHSRTTDLPALCREADILVAAVGRADMIRGDWIKPGAAVVDVGINRTDAGLRGDVAQEEAAEVAGWLTPVPGGVGPMTIALLLANTLQAASGAWGNSGPAHNVWPETGGCKAPPDSVRFRGTQRLGGFVLGRGHIPIWPLPASSSGGLSLAISRPTLRAGPPRESELKIAIFGGTGDLGRGLAVNFAAAGHEIIVGSRSQERADQAADTLREDLPEGNFVPMENVAAAEAAEIAIVSIPWEGVEATIPPMAGALAGKVVISVINALEFGKNGATAITNLPGGSMAQRIQELAPEAKVAMAYNNLPAGRLQKRETIDADVLVCGRGKDTRETVMELTEGAAGRPGARRRHPGQRPDHRGLDRDHHQPQPPLRRRGLDQDRGPARRLTGTRRGPSPRPSGQVIPARHGRQVAVPTRRRRPIPLHSPTVRRHPASPASSIAAASIPRTLERGSRVAPLDDVPDGAALTRGWNDVGDAEVDEPDDRVGGSEPQARVHLRLVDDRARAPHRRQPAGVGGEQQVLDRRRRPHRGPRGRAHGSAPVPVTMQAMTTGARSSRADSRAMTSVPQSGRLRRNRRGVRLADPPAGGAGQHDEPPWLGQVMVGRVDRGDEQLLDDARAERDRPGPCRRSAAVGADPFRSPIATVRIPEVSARLRVGRSAVPERVELVLVHAEVVAQLVQHGDADLVDELVVRWRSRRSAGA